MGDVINLGDFRERALGKKPDVASGIVVTPDNKILVFERFDKDTGEIFYDLPGGKIEPSERSMFQALRRELFEELDIIIGENTDYLGKRESPSPACQGSFRFYYGIFDYDGLPYDKLGRAEGHLALLILSPEDALEKVRDRITPEASIFMQNVQVRRKSHEAFVARWRREQSLTDFEM